MGHAGSDPDPVPLNVFGKVVEGMEVATKLAIDDIIKTITISQK